MKIPVICTTVLVEKSPQAIPLGAACIASSLKNNEFLAKECDVSLFAISAVSAAENITDDVFSIEETADDFVNVEFSEINDYDVNNYDSSKALSLNDSNNDEEISYSDNDDLISIGTTDRLL